MIEMRAPITCHIHDSRLDIWQEDCNDDTFKKVFKNLLGGLRRRGWTITTDPKIVKHLTGCSPSHRFGFKGDLFVELSVDGRSIDIEFWAETWPLDNRNGQRYDFGKMARLHYLDRQRVILERRRIIRWLMTFAPVTVKAEPSANLSAMARIELDYAEGSHSDKTAGRPLCASAYNWTSRDKGKIEHGATVWYVDHKGRICRGTAYYSLNNSWYVVNGETSLTRTSSQYIFVNMPVDLRVKHNARLRRSRLERELETSVRRMDFRRAELIKNILFGGEVAYLIWHKVQHAYYRANSGGYTTDTISAGRYTLAEAQKQVSGHSDILDVIGPDGKPVSEMAVAA